MDHNGRTKTCFVRENASLAALGDDVPDDDSGCGACDGLDAESELEDGCECCRDRRNVNDNEDQGSEDVCDCHEGNDLLGNGCDPLKTSDDDDACGDHEEDSDYERNELNAAENRQIIGNVREEC